MGHLYTMSMGKFVYKVNVEKKIKSAPKSDLFTFSGVYKVCFAMILDP